jgi:hypothetical protein
MVTDYSYIKLMKKMGVRRKTKTKTQKGGINISITLHVD